MAAHAKLGASNAERWWKCPGSVKACADIPNVDSVYAAEGTAAHELAAACLEGLKDASDCVGMTFNGFEVTDEMASAVQVYLDTVRGDHNGEETDMGIEQRFDLSHVYPGCFGTNDALLYRESEGLLIVYDYKHGRGVPVEVEGNKQLLYYALGASTGKHNRRLDTIELVIVQPRCPHPNGSVRRWRFDAVDLLDFEAELRAAAGRTEGSDERHAGTWCKFCPAAPTCPALRDHALEAAKAEFAESGEVIVSPPASFSAEGLAKLLPTVDIIEDWCRRVREHAHHEAEAGRVPPGYKLVASRPSRKWKDEEAAREWLVKYGLDDADIYVEPKMKTVPQMEKVMGKSKSDLAPLWESVSSGTVLAPAADKRPAVKPEASEEFA